MKHSIIIVSYNTKDLTLQTITSVGFHPDREIIVVDNASKDDSVQAIKQKFGDKVKIIARQDNAGFSRANNEGIEIAIGAYILLLNSDTIVHDDAVSTMVDVMEGNPKVGVLSCRLLNTDGSYQPQGGALPTLWNIAAWWLWPLPGNIPGIDPYQNTTEPLLPDSNQGSSPLVERKQTVERGWVGGTAMMIRREVIQRVGVLDEKFFMYAEDVDYCMRVHQEGLDIGITPMAVITHIGSASTSSSNALRGEIKGLLYLWKKHFPAWQRLLLRLIFLKGAMLRWFLFGILMGRREARTLYAQIFHSGLR
jgi:GT2 family glycosyltransferase